MTEAERSRLHEIVASIRLDLEANADASVDLTDYEIACVVDAYRRLEQERETARLLRRTARLYD